ncbi:MAG: SUMF1/EgtB/PvdO family nonheme iron enzyme [Deltaproteobacteria bacterium]|nr:SUMF1/EgtB/PvdO family nonheme iron enzyme [Deltaproteobacteria bacterium]
MFLRRVAVAAFVASSCGGGCDCGDTNLTGDAGEFVIPPAETVGTPCTESEPCDDAEPCNGLETCSPETGRCTGGELVADFTQCTTEDGRYASCVDGVCDLHYEEVFVPAGPFVMGVDSDEDDFGCIALPATPKRIVTVSGFFIDRYEMTNRRFKRCQRVGQCPADWGERRQGSFLRDPYFSDPQYDDYPLTSTWMTEAADYCAYEGKRLPTEAEWEKAARGGCEVAPPDSCGPEDERVVPWDSPPLGDFAYTCNEANYARYVGGSCPDDTDEVGRRPAGRSPYGLDDMIGNVREWTGDCITPYEECPGGCVDPRIECDTSELPLDWNIPVRGGSFICFASLTHRESTGTRMGGPETGFRCVRPVSGTSGGSSAKRGAGPLGAERRGGEEHDRGVEPTGPVFDSARRTLGMEFAGGGPATTASLNSARGSTSARRRRRRRANSRGSTNAIARRRCGRTRLATPTWTTSPRCSGTT